MADGIKIIRAVPGSNSLLPILREFCRSEGVVTAFSDSLLFALRPYVEDDVPVTVEPFGKVVREFLALCGESALYIAPSTHRLAAIAHACADLTDTSPFFASRHYPGTHQAIARVLDDLADYGFGPGEMTDFVAAITPPALVGLDLFAEPSGADFGRRNLGLKLRSLAEIAKSADLVMERFGRQSSSEHIRACLDSVPERDGSFERLLVFAGGEIPPLKQEWLKWARRHGTSITVVLDRHAMDAPLFPLAELATEQIGSKAERRGSGNVLTNNLFAAETPGSASIDVQVVNAADPLAETEWAIRGCLGHPAPDRCAIYARSLEQYAPLIESAAHRLGLPVRIYRRAPLLTNGFARLTLAVIEFCAGNDVRRLENIARSSYVGLDAVGRKALASALRDAHRLRTGAWESLETYANGRRDSLPWLGMLLDWRRKAIAGPMAPREWMGLLTELIRADESVPWSTSAMQADRRMRERDIRARNRMERLLGDDLSVQNIDLARPLNLRNIAELCRKLWEASDVSIPPEEHGVQVTDTAETILNNDTLFVLGMLEGVFPRRRTENPVLTDMDLRHISERIGHRIPNSQDRSRSERDEFYRVCAAAGNRIVFSFPATDDQRDNIPAFYLEEVKRAAGSHYSEVKWPRPLLAPPADHCHSEADLCLRAALDSPREPAPANILETPAARLAAAAPPDAEFTPSELRDALQCPFQYVARHRLDVRPKRPQARWHSLRKLPLAADLSVQGDVRAATSALSQALETELESLYGDLPEWELQLLRSGGSRLISDWVQREFKARQKWPKDDVKRHVKFGDELKAAMPGGAQLRGAAPAVSKLGTYRVAHLYQSSAPENTEMEDSDRLFYGLHLMALYDGRSDLGLEIETMTGRRVLMVLGRSAETFLPGDQALKLRVLDLAGSDDPVAARKQFFLDVKRLLKDAMAAIRNGDIEPKPGPHCVWCDYGELCRRSSAFPDEEPLFGSDRPQGIEE